MRRVQCSKCKKVVIEKVPWADGKNHLTFFYIKYLSDWAKEMAWQTVANRFRTSWQSVHRSVQSVVNYGLKHRNIADVKALGIDKVQYHAGHKYMTLVYQIDKGSRRLL